MDVLDCGRAAWLIKGSPLAHRLEGGNYPNCYSFPHSPSLAVHGTRRHARVTVACRQATVRSI